MPFQLLPGYKLFDTVIMIEKWTSDVGPNLLEWSLTWKVLHC